jgi:hypothetical protein
MDYYDGQDNTTLSLSIVHPSATTKYSAIGQTFAGNGSSVYVIRFKLSKYGSPSGNLKVAIYAHTGTWGSTGKPTGSGLATSNTIPITSLGANPDWVDFTFSSTYSTVNGTKYCAVLYVDTGATVDASNYVKAWYINSNGHAGNGFYYYNSAWTNWTSYDVFFAVFQTNEGVGGDIVTATPNYAGGWVLDAAYPFLWDNYWTVGQMAVDGLTAFYVPLRQVAYTTNHRLEPKYIKGWAAACTDGSCTVAYKSVNSGATTSFSSNLGSRPVDHYHYDAQGHITKTCYKQYQWLLDGNVVGTDSSSYTIPVQTDGTVHTIAVQWDGPQPE